MIEVYHADGTRSLRVVWTLEELGIPYEARLVAFPARPRHPEYLDVNPTGSLPALIDGAARMTESMAICHYLDQTYGSTRFSVLPVEAEYADYLQFCFYGEATLTQPLGAIVRQKLLEPEDRRRPQIVEDARSTFVRRLEPVRRALGKGDYLAARRFSLADVSVGYALGLADRLGEGDLITGEIRDYAARLAARPAYRRAYGLPPHNSTKDAPI